MSMVWFCGHNIKGALKLKSKSSLTKLQLITQLILTLQSILYTYYANSTLGTVNEQMIIVGICDAVMIFATLLMVSQTNVVLITIKKLNIYIQIGLFFITITLHVGLSGSMYLSYCWQSYIDWCPSFDFLNLWYNLVPYWILITFTWNTLPSLVILITLMFALDKNTTILKTIHKLYSLDKYYIYLIGLQIVITASFFSSGILYGYTNILGDDKWSVLMLLFQRVLLTMHSIINHLTLNRVIGIIQNLQKCDSFFTSKVESHLRN
ncbi:hypothetical protein BC833DRAFT_610756 [Globomyces pollinis-pini]|nr:hypothetical protein BC833DRAFT_610756 [Globomyces pollinis-pini]